MDRLNIKTFIRAAGDLELSKYQTLGSIQSYTKNLHSNKLYPALDDLQEIVFELEAILEQRSQINFCCSSELMGLKTENDLPIFETSAEYENEICKMFEFIRWALPQLKECLQEAEAIYEFVYDEISIKEVGIVPLYNREGYFVIPDNRERNFYFYRYENTFLNLEKTKSHCLKTILIDVEDENIKKNPKENGFKMQLLNKFNDLPNPATYIIETELDFPFEDTMLPIAKKKLTKYLTAC